MHSLHLIFPPSGPFYSFLCRIKIEKKKKSADGAPRSFVIYIIPLKRVMIGRRRRRHGTRENIIESNISSSFSAEKMMRCTDTPTDPCVFSSSFFEQKIYTEERSHRRNVCELKAADAEPSRAFITGAVRDCGRKKRTHRMQQTRKKRKRKNGGDRLHDSLRTATASSSTCVGVRRREKKRFGVLYDVR
jgi:hypothetical protein